MNDQDGELIGPVVRGGREGMPKSDLTDSTRSRAGGNGTQRAQIPM